MPHLAYVVGVTGYDPAENARRLELVRAFVRPGFTIDLVIPPDGPQILEQPAHFEHLQRAMLATVQALQPESCAAIISAGAVDPGLASLRAATRIPVIGPGEAALFLARLLGTRLAILAVEPAVAGAHAMIRTVPAKPDVVVVRPMHTTVRRILSNPDEGRRIMRETAAAAIREDKADMLYLGSMTQGTLGMTQKLQAEFGVPVLDPLPISIAAAEQAALARSGQ